MKEIKMYEDNKGGIHKTATEAERCDTKLKVDVEVSEFLKERSKDSPGYSIASHKEALAAHWEHLKKWFGSGGAADEGVQKMIYGLCMGGLDTEGETHKQWFLEEILKLLVEDIEETHSRYEWLRGTEPPTPPSGMPNE